MKRLGINTFNAIASIVGAVMTGTVLLWMFTDVTVWTYYCFGMVLVVTNIIGLVKTIKLKGNKTGNILGLIASALHSVSGLLSFPAMVIYIVGCVFLFKSKVDTDKE